MTGMIQKWPANGCFLETLPNMFWGLPRWSDADFQVKCCFLNTAAGYYLYPEFPLDFWCFWFFLLFSKLHCCPTFWPIPGSNVLQIHIFVSTSQMFNPTHLVLV
jgi:hypothetical protein